MPTLDDIQIRDPYVLPLPSEGKYYLFGTTDPDCWQPPATGFDCYASADLREWEGPWPAFRPPPGFWADRNFWAPEVHAYRGLFYMFASFKAPGICRGTQVLCAEHPRGPYAEHSERPLTPPSWECLDGTLYVDRQGVPWLVFCHEWVQVDDGRICALRLSADLRNADGEPQLLFSASQAPWTRPIKPGGIYATDGPFLFAASDGAFMMLWSSFTDSGYAVGCSRSRSGSILGPWEHDSEPLYSGDGGHGMIFRNFTGELFLALHSPNATPDERARLLPLEEREDRLWVRPPIRDRLGQQPSTTDVYEEPREVTDLAQCYFYHEMDIPEFGYVEGEWDLRGRESQYLGDANFRGKRVLEIGTASGHLCFFMESQGAEVVAFDLSEDFSWDNIPYPRTDVEERAVATRAHIGRINNGYWLCHRAFGSKARVVYGSAYDIPVDIGPVDTTVFGSVLLHLRDPFLALQQASRLTRELMVVTDVVGSGKGAGMEFLPNPETGKPVTTWWSLSPGFVQRALGVLGFESSTVTFHHQRFRTSGVDMPLFTVTAYRTSGIESCDR